MIVNKVRKEGNSIYIKSIPQTGIIALTSFVDNVAGENINNYFTKTFRYSLNGIVFTDWQPLTTPNITSIPVGETDILVIELQYQKNPVGTSSISVSTATIGTTDAVLSDTDLFKNSIFSQFFDSNNIDVLNWMINVLEKLFEKGLIPNYIDRYNDEGNPDDFIEFWGSVCKFFAYYVIYARKYQNFHESETLLAEYLEQRGLPVSPNNDLAQLQEMMKKYNREVAKRGTIHIVDKEGINGNLYDGEIFRLINFTEGDEFLMNVSKSEHTGWNIGNCSPMYRSVTNQDNLNKYYEPSSSPINIAKYPINGTVSIITDAGRKVFSIAANSGIAQLPGNLTAFKIPVDEYMDYEFSFFIKKTDGLNLTVGFNALDEDDAAVNLISRSTGSVLNNYFVSKNIQRSDKYIYCRFFLYNKLKPLYANDGLNLKMVDGVKYVIPRIMIGTGSALVYNVRLVPMALPYSRGFVQVNNFIDLLVKNNNKRFDLLDIENYVKKYLTSYSSQVKISETIRTGDFSLEV